MARTARRPLTTATVLGASALLIAGCSLTTPVQTLQPYAPGDGLRVELTDLVRAENLMILTHAEGTEGTLFGALVNDGTDDVVFTVGLADERMRVPVEAGERVLLGMDEFTRIESVAAPPGAVTDVVLATPGYGAVTAPVPVLDGTLDPYDEHVP